MFTSKYLRFEGRSCMLCSAKMVGKKWISKTSSRKWPLSLDNRFQQLWISERQFARCSDVVSWKRVVLPVSWCCLAYLCAVGLWRRNLRLIVLIGSMRHLVSQIQKTEELLVWSRLDFQSFCEPAFLSPHHGWITGLAIVFLDQSPPSLIESSRLGCDWSILSLVFLTWRKTVLMSFLLL